MHLIKSKLSCQMEGVLKNIIECHMEEMSKISQKKCHII